MSSFRWFILLVALIVPQMGSQSPKLDNAMIESTFNLFDANHNGLIESGELLTQIRYIRSGDAIIPVNGNVVADGSVIARSVNNLFESFDGNSNGLNFSEFERMFNETFVPFV
jgi:Ca2+-binding EF-hand superfamily protein